MHSVFSIDELYNKILSYLDKADSARAALVCKLWTEAAMNAVWETANFKIFRALDSTLVERRGVMYFLDLSSLDEDNRVWQRFLINCQRTRRFDSSPLTGGPELLAPSRRVIEHLQDDKVLFPCLTYLAVSDESMVPLFMSSTITELVWVFNRRQSHSPHSFLKNASAVANRMPDISTLSLLGDSLALNLNSNVIELCTSLPRLRTVKLGRHTLSPPLLQTLMQKPTLTSIEIDTASITFRDQHQAAVHPTVCRWLDPAARFPMKCMTQLLAFAIALPDIRLAQSFFASGPIPTIRLQRLQLFLTYPQFSREPQLRNFLYDLYDWSPNLLELELTMVVDARLPAQVANVERLSFHTIKPLLRLSQLRTIVLVHSYPIHVTDSEAELLARGWPEMRCLSLNPNPVVLDSTPTSLYAISSFVRWCPSITKLSLYVDGTLPVKLDAISSSSSPIANLHVLDLGASSCPKESNSNLLWNVAEFLSKVLTSETHIHTGLFDAPDDVQQFMPDGNGNLVIMPAFYLLEYSQSWGDIASMQRSFREWVRLGGLDAWMSSVEYGSD